MGFCCIILSVNDLTPSPISRPGTHCLQWQRADVRANLWWRHEHFPGETNIALRPCTGKAWVAKGSWWCFGIIPSNGCCQFSMISQMSDFGRNPPLIPHPVASEHRWLVKAPRLIHSVPDVSGKRSWRSGCHARLWNLHDVTNAFRL